MIARLVLVAALAQAAQTCSPSLHRGARVQLDAVRPDSVLLPMGGVVEVVLHGHGFAPGSPGQNTVIFASSSINNVPANEDGTQIRFVIPETLPSGGEAPPRRLDAGAYEIRVKNGSDSSNVAMVRVYR